MLTESKKKCENYANALIDDVNKIRGVIQIKLDVKWLRQSPVYSMHDNLKTKKLL